MNTPERNRLLMEMAGISSPGEVRDLSTALKTSPLYIEAKIQLHRASLSNRPSSLKDYAELRDLDFAVTTMADYASLEVYVLSYAIRSFPAYWTNPFEWEKDKQSPLSIGSLLVFRNGKPCSIDDLLTDETIPDEEKEEILSQRVEGWRKDEAEKAVKAAESVGKEESPLLRALSLSLGASLFLFGNAYTFYLYSNPLLSPFALAPDGSYLSTYAILLTTASLFFYDAFFALILCLQTHRNRELTYARGIAKRRLSRWLDELRKRSSALREALLDHVARRVPLSKTSLSDFVFKGGREVDRIYRMVYRKRRRWIRSVFVAVSWLFAFVLIFSIAIVAIDLQRGVAI